jgi:hypothetical protein
VHAILLLNIEATRREGEVTSRWFSLFKVAYNESTLRVMLSPCQYYVDKAQRDKPDARMRNGLWCGISPDNANACYIWTGSVFVTKEHGDVRTNEWVAWSITPIGTPPPELFDDDGSFALFTDGTERVTADLVQVQADLSGPIVATQVMRTGNATAQQRVEGVARPVQTVQANMVSLVDNTARDALLEEQDDFMLRRDPDVRETEDEAAGTLLVLAPPMSSLQAKFGKIPTSLLPSAVNPRAHEYVSLRKKALATSRDFSLSLGYTAANLASTASVSEATALTQEASFQAMEAYDALADDCGYHRA